MSTIIAISIWATRFLYQLIGFVVVFALIAPVWCLVLAALLLLIPLVLGLVHGLGIVLGGAVDGHELQRLGFGGVDELVLGACGYHDDICGFDVLLRGRKQGKLDSVRSDSCRPGVSVCASTYLVFACHRRPTFSAREDQDLVHGVHLVSDVTANGNLH